MKRFSAQKQISGFTLLEILIAISIFSLVMTMLISSHSLVFSNAQTLQENVTISEMAKNCMDRMASDLQSIYVNLPPAYEPPEFDAPTALYRVVGEMKNIGNGRFSTLRFTSSAHLPIGQAIQGDGIAEIVYYAMETNGGDIVLRRADKLYPYEDFEEDENDPVLCEHVASLVVKYYDEEGAEYDTWDSESFDFKYATPRAVMIILEIETDNVSQIFQTRITLPIYREKIELY